MCKDLSSGNYQQLGWRQNMAALEIRTDVTVLACQLGDPWETVFRFVTSYSVQHVRKGSGEHHGVQQAVTRPAMLAEDEWKWHNVVEIGYSLFYLNTIWARAHWLHFGSAAMGLHPRY